MTPTYDWDHHASIGGGGVAGSGFGEWRLRGRGGAPAAARVPASAGAMRGNGQWWKLEWGLGKSSEALAGGRIEWRGVLACGGGNGGLTRGSCNGGYL
jgi:hypothetical protein